MLSHQPAAVDELGDQLLSDPRLALARRPDAEQTPALDGHLPHQVGQRSDGRRTIHDKSGVDHAGRGDRAEVLPKLRAAQNLLGARVGETLPCGPGKANEGGGDVDRRAVLVREAPSPELVGYPAQQNPFEWPRLQEVTRHRRSTDLHDEVFTDPLEVGAVPILVVAVAEEAVRVPGSA